MPAPAGTLRANRRMALIQIKVALWPAA